MQTKLYLLIIWPIIALVSCVHSAYAEAFRWPDGQKAAIALTYDDALDSHLDVVIPQLDSAGVQATFYLSGARDNLQGRLAEWRAAALKGHELGNHTLHHPCKKSNPDRDWVAPYYDMDKYTLAQYENEIRVTNTLLHAVDGKSKRTFAYPCSDSDVNGGESIIPILKKHVTAARFASTPLKDAAESEQQNTVYGLDMPLNLDRYMINAMDASGMTGQQLIGVAKRSLGGQKIMTYVFHGVTDHGEYLTVSPEAHQALINHLAQHQEDYWVAPLQVIIAYLDGESVDAY